jgi:hypothetical protein
MSGKRPHSVSGHNFSVGYETYVLVRAILVRLILRDGTPLNPALCGFLWAHAFIITV